MADVTREEIDSLEKRIAKLEAMFEVSSVQAVEYDPQDVVTIGTFDVREIDLRNEATTNL